MKLNRGSNTMSRGKKRKEKKGDKQTQGFGKCREVGGAEGEGRDLRDGGEEGSAVSSSPAICTTRQDKRKEREVNVPPFKNPN